MTVAKIKGNDCQMETQEKDSRPLAGIYITNWSYVITRFSILNFEFLIAFSR
jgi:hypothetical protein